ncbi:MAG: WG repeat-containing protein [Ignavibacteriaceae bacterium]|nr:WG repeat-containing protein [Ignavibacteriaceae bacterium]
MRKSIYLTFSLLLLNAISIYAQKEVVCQQVGNFREGLAPFMLDNKIGFINIKGDIAIEPKYAYFIEEYGELPYFSNDYTVVLDPETERCGYIDGRGELQIPYQYVYAFGFSEEAAFVRIGDEISIIDSKARVLAKNILALNAYHSKFREGRAACSREFSYGYVDKTGKFVIEPVYDEVRDFSDGLAAVKKEGKWGFIDKDGKTVVPFQFSNEPKSFSDNRAFVLGTNNTWGIIDKEGKLLIEPKYKQVFPFSSGYAVVSIMDNKFKETFYIIDVNGKAVKEYAKGKSDKETITLWSGFSEGLAIGMKEYKKGMIDPQGKVVVNFLYRDLKPLSSGMAYFEKYDEKTKKVSTGFINKKGEEVILIKAPQF